MKVASYHFSHSDDEKDAIEYLTALTDGLQREVEQCVDEHKLETLRELTHDIEEFRLTCTTIPLGLDYTKWQKLWHDYRLLVHRKASLLNALADVARSYTSMDEFWEDADSQVRGESRYTFWDTYEHGRRRQLEHIFARAYGAESALLLNSGMSAIAVIIGMLKLSRGCKILTGEYCYFETSDYLRRFIAESGIEVLRSPVDDVERFFETLREAQPELVLIETVTNLPGVTVPRGFKDWLSVSPGTFFMIDNSVQSHLTRWFEILESKTSQFVVVESATKYLTQECMAGVVYGCAEVIDEAREFARATGQQLQEKSFNYLCEAEVEMASRKLARHTRNVSVFQDELKNFSSMFQVNRTLDAELINGNNQPEVNEIFQNGVGALIFIALSPLFTNGLLKLEQMHRSLLKCWCERAKAIGLEVPVRAGFGWNRTTARVYESQRLNQADSPSYLRISVGIEPIWIIRLLARSLGEAAFDISRITKPEEQLNYGSN